MQIATEELPPSPAGNALSATSLAVRTPEELSNIVSEFAATEGWIERVRLSVDDRWYERLYHGVDHDIWVISWLPGQSTGFHDHGESQGAFVVAMGWLEEHRPGHPPLPIAPQRPRSFGADYAHDVRNVSSAPAVSIHAYSPPLNEMNEYELEGSLLIPREPEQDRTERPLRRPIPRPPALTIDQKLSAARAGLDRLSPNEAYEAAVVAGATLIDIRPEAQRTIEGVVPGALIVERNVLEWRLDPFSSTRLPVAVDHDIQVIVFCSEGYTSSLAAAALKELGLWRATDIVGGFQAWRAAGLTSVPGASAGLDQ